ncbi:hypothetical protein [Naasia sp. SYSU D00948]|uniref:hypothetical protein n=1 Tax=Naasia sp. SYSU D00948 TaxID=2817379 RepID=UPI001B30FBEB|nr:hypothetical protein [Naasia sp. SYSU D00948]
MTMWQEQQRERPGTASASAGQHRSRREARDAERRANETGDLSNVHPSGVVDFNSSGNIWDTLSRRAASQLTEAATEAERRTGRRVSDMGSPVEPFSHSTPGRPQVPTYDARRPAVPTYGSGLGTQRRSFAPEPVVPEAEDTRTRPTSRIDSILGYSGATGAPRLLADEAPATDLSASLDHTMTRRELRALRETGQAPSFAPVSSRQTGAWMPAWEPQAAPVAPAAPAPVVPAPAAAELAGTAFSAYTDTATVEMSAVDRASLEAEVPVTLTSDEPGQDTVLMDTPAATFSLPTPAKSPAARRHEPMAAPGAFTPPSSAPAAPVDGLQGFEALIAQASIGFDAPTPATGPQPQRQEAPSAPAGHWSAQTRYKDDDELPFGSMLSRNVGSSSGSTNALIMPKDPQPDLLSAVNSTGEIFITGSLDLPRILSSTGAPSDHYDSSEIDRLFEASQEEHQTNEVSPVRAARAVATHTSTRSVVAPRKRHGAMLPTVLAITAALMAVGVVGLLFAGYVLRIF